MVIPADRLVFIPDDQVFNEDFIPDVGKTQEDFLGFLQIPKFFTGERDQKQIPALQVMMPASMSSYERHRVP